MFHRILVLVLALNASASFAQDDPYRACLDSKEQEAKRTACDAVIAGGGRSDAELALAYGNRAVAFSMARDYQRSLEDFDTSYQLDDSTYLALENRIKILEALGDTEALITEHKRILDVNPRYVKGYEEIGILSYQSGDRENADLYLDLARLYSSPNPDVYAYIALMMHETGDYESAATYIADVHALWSQNNRLLPVARRQEPSEKPAWYSTLWGDNWFGRGQYSDAINHYTYAIERNPGEINAFWGRAQAYDRLGDLDNTIADYASLVKLWPDLAVGRNNLAWAMFRHGQAAEGLEHAERAVELDPTQAPYLDTRANIYEALGRTEDAIRDFGAALELDPSLTVVRQALERLTK